MRLNFSAAALTIGLFAALVVGGTLLVRWMTGDDESLAEDLARNAITLFVVFAVLSYWEKRKAKKSQKK